MSNDPRSLSILGRAIIGGPGLDAECAESLQETRNNANRSGQINISGLSLRKGYTRMD